MYKLTPEAFIKESGVIFGIIAVVHLIRVFAGWPIIIGNWEFPLWASVFPIGIAGGFALKAWRLSSRK